MARALTSSRLRLLVLSRLLAQGQVKRQTLSQQDLLLQQPTAQATSLATFGLLQRLHAQSAETAAELLSHQYDEAEDASRLSRDGDGASAALSSNSSGHDSSACAAAGPSSVDATSGSGNDQQAGGSHSTLGKEQRLELVYQFIARYKQENRGELPTAGRLRREVGGSWYTWQNLLKQEEAQLRGAGQASTPAAGQGSDKPSQEAHTSEEAAVGPSGGQVSTASTNEGLQEGSIEAQASDPGPSTSQKGGQEEGQSRTGVGSSLADPEGALSRGSLHEDAEIAALDYPSGQVPETLAASMQSAGSHEESIAGSSSNASAASRGQIDDDEPREGEAGSSRFLQIGISEIPWKEKASWPGRDKGERDGPVKQGGPGTVGSVDTSNLHGVYLEGLWPQLRHAELAKMFGDCEGLVAAKVCPSPLEPLNSFGFLYFKTAEGAQAAIRKVSTIKVLQDRRVRAEVARSQLKHVRGIYMVSGTTVASSRSGPGERPNSADEKPYRQEGQSGPNIGQAVESGSELAGPKGSWLELLDRRGALGYGVSLWRVPEGCAAEAVAALQQYGEVAHSRITRRYGRDSLYLDYKTEAAQRRALAQGHVWVSEGTTPLPLVRRRPIVPVAVRLSRVPSHVSNHDLRESCQAIGPVLGVRRRASSVADVHFKDADLVHIVAKLNQHPCGWQAHITPHVPRELAARLERNTLLHRFVVRVAQTMLQDMEMRMEAMQADVADTREILTMLAIVKGGS